MARSLSPYRNPPLGPRERTDGREPRLPERFLRWTENLRTRVGTLPQFTYTTGSPEGVINGQKGDLYFDTTANVYYTKTTDTGNTGWTLVTPSGLTGTGLDTQIAYWTGASTLAGNTRFIYDDATDIFTLGDGTTINSPQMRINAISTGDPRLAFMQNSVEVAFISFDDTANELRIDSDNRVTLRPSNTDSVIITSSQFNMLMNTAVLGNDTTAVALFIDAGTTSDGSIIFRNNNVTAATILWDQSTGALDFNIGGTDVVIMDTDGTQFLRQAYSPTSALVDGANIAWNLLTAQTASVTLAGNRTLDNPTNMQDGSTYILRVTQDATGSRTLAFGTAYDWPGGTAPTLTTTANAVDILTFVSDGTSMFGVAQLDFS